MAKKDRNAKASATERGTLSAQPRLHQRAAEIQEYGTVSHLLPLELEEPVRLLLMLSYARPVPEVPVLWHLA